MTTPEHSIAEMWDRVLTRTQPADNGCIEWQGARLRGDHGLIGAKRNGKWVTVYTHRVAWEAVHGPIPAGMCICHHCDNPPCVNVDHLFLGTRADNLRDMWRKGRAREQGATHCRNGHDRMLPDAIKTYTTSTGQTVRRCRQCSDAAMARFVARRQQEAS